MNLIKHICAAALAAAAIALPAAAQSQQETYFQYPTVPESIEGLTPRSDYMMEHFWDRCNLKQAFSSLKKMRGAFDDYVSLMPFASGPAVKASTEALLKEVSKTPRNLLAMAEWAEASLYSDTARVKCDECYLPFAKAVASNRKIPKAEKARFEYQAKVLEGAQVGMIAPDFAYTTPDGTTAKLSEIAPGPYILLFINDPDCDECQLARVRLAANIDLNSLIDRGLIKVMSIYPGEYDPDWAEQAATYPSRWIVGAAPDVDELYDMRNPPVFYYLNGRHKILSKSLVVDNLIEAFHRVNVKSEAEQSQKASEPEAAEPVSDTSTEESAN